MMLADCRTGSCSDAKVASLAQTIRELLEALTTDASKAGNPADRPQNGSQVGAPEDTAAVRIRVDLTGVTVDLQPAQGTLAGAVNAYTASP